MRDGHKPSPNVSPFMTLKQETSIAIGKFQVTPIIYLTESGSFAPSVSIRSGTGRASHDRVYRFVARFESHRAAVRYALDQALAWIKQPSLYVQTQP